jgi:hypothetical protein
MMGDVVFDAIPASNFDAAKTKALLIVKNVPQIAAKYKTPEVLLLYGDDFSHIQAD